MKHLHTHHSKVMTQVGCLILTLALFAPCLTVANWRAYPVERNTLGLGNFGPTGLGFTDFNRAREFESEPLKAADPANPNNADVVVDPSTNAPPSVPQFPQHRSDVNALGTQNGLEERTPNSITAFNDVPSTHEYYSQIEIIKNLQVTLGCNPNLYCPNDPVKREQMAAFIMRSLGEFNPPPPSSQRFGDVPPSNQFYNFIDRLAVLGITLGCQPGNPPLYCPNDSVTRGQMVTFLERAVGRGSPPTPAAQRFLDVPTDHDFYAFIESFVQHGMARGAMNGFMRHCNNGLDGQHFCPDQALTRAEMAALLVIEFG